MFQSARIKLTAWYLLIIMLISISFSLAIYRVLIVELDRVERLQRLRIERRIPNFGPSPIIPDITARPFSLDHDLVSETKNRLLLFLAGINLAVLASSAAAGYFLAGRTLKPIKVMVEEENRFITDASHELRTPLTSLKSEIEVNLRDKNLTLTDAKRLLESNLEEVNNLQVLSDSLIKLAKYPNGKNHNTPADLLLSSVVDEAIKKVGNIAKQKQIQIRSKIGKITLVGDKQSLMELFVIFLDNAIKYSPNNSVVDIATQKTDNHLVISIRDQGIGIEDKEIPHLFDRFYRTDKSRTKSEISGYGLGLSIAKQIIDEHHGTVDVKSKVNSGTTFIVKLPVKSKKGYI